MGNDKKKTNRKKKQSRTQKMKEGSFQEALMKQIQEFRTPLSMVMVTILMMGITLSILYFDTGKQQQQISFQEFMNKLLEPGLVDHIVVSDKNVAQIYVLKSPRNQTETNSPRNQTETNSPHNQTETNSPRNQTEMNSPRNQTETDGEEETLPAKGYGGQYKYYFNIGNVFAFEEKLERAQIALGVDHHDFVPVTYSSEIVWHLEFMTFIQHLLPLAFLIYMVAGGKGPFGVFNIGKPHFTKVDKDAKNKVRWGYFILL